MDKPKDYKPVTTTTNSFKCGDCGKRVRRPNNWYNPYGAGWEQECLLHRCSLCIREIAIEGNGQAYHELYDRAKASFNLTQNNPLFSCS